MKVALMLIALRGVVLMVVALKMVPLMVVTSMMVALSVVVSWLEYNLFEWREKHDGTYPRLAQLWGRLHALT